MNYYIDFKSDGVVWFSHRLVMGRGCQFLYSLYPFFSLGPEILGPFLWVFLGISLGGIALRLGLLGAFILLGPVSRQSSSGLVVFCCLCSP